MKHLSFQSAINQFQKQTSFKDQLTFTSTQSIDILLVPNQNAEKFGSNCCFAGGCCKISLPRQWRGPKPIQNAAAACEERHGHMSGLRSGFIFLDKRIGTSLTHLFGPIGQMPYII